MKIIRALTLGVALALGAGTALTSGCSSDTKPVETKPIGNGHDCCKGSADKVEINSKKTKEEPSGKVDEGLLKSLEAAGLKGKLVTNITQLYPQEKGIKLLKTMGWQELKLPEGITFQAYKISSPKKNGIQFIIFGYNSPDKNNNLIDTFLDTHAGNLRQGITMDKNGKVLERGKVRKVGEVDE